MDGTITIYADVLFFINFCIDFLCFFVTAKILCVPIKSFRMAVSSALGGIYSCLAVLMEGFAPILLLACHILSLLIICLVCFGKEKLTAKTGVFALTCGFIGGLMCGAYALTGKGFYVNGGFYFDADPFFVLVFACIATVASVFYLLLFKRRKTTFTVNIVFSFSQNVFKANLLCDTGCFVRDSISGDPVIIISKSVLGKTVDISGVDSKSLTAVGKTARLIPIQTVTGVNMLIGFRPDSLIIKSENKAKSVPAIIAVDCENTNYGGCDGIIPYELI